MKSIGILTIHNSTNYGACLQSFALYEYLRSQGHSVKLIDLHRPVHSDYIPSRFYVPYYERRVSTIEKVKSIIRIILPDPFKRYKHEFNKSNESFKKFNDVIELTKVYTSIDELYHNPPIFDTYVTGSDQLWNPNQPFCLEPYFLTFAPEGTRKISYAASIGVTSLQDNVKKDFAKWLSEYDAISVREKKGKELLESFTNLKISQVPDPTFLLSREEWSRYAIVPNYSEPYICLFNLTGNAGLLRLAREMADVNNCKLVVLGHFKRKYPNDLNCEIIRSAGPREFIGYIKKASCVLTDSFHGSVFSILMGARNFYSYIPDEDPVARSKGSRITDLLESFGLDDHLLRNDVNLDYNGLYEKCIDTERTKSVMEQSSQVGKDFLSANI